MPLVLLDALRHRIIGSDYAIVLHKTERMFKGIMSQTIVKAQIHRHKPVQMPSVDCSVKSKLDAAAAIEFHKGLLRIVDFVVVIEEITETNVPIIHTLGVGV